MDLPRALDRTVPQQHNASVNFPPLSGEGQGGVITAYLFLDMPVDALNHRIDIADELLVCEPQNREAFLAQEIITLSIVMPSFGSVC